LSAKNWFKFVFLGLVWGSSFLWIKLALGEVGPFTLVLFRAGIAFMGLVVVWIVQRPEMHWSDLWKFAVMGVFNHAFPIVLISWSEQHISSGLASILNSTVPLFTIMIAPLFLSDERITLKRALGLVIGFSGVIIIASDNLMGGDSLIGIGILLMLVAACSYALSGIFARKVMTGIRAEAQSIGQMGMAFFFMIPATLIFEPPFHFPVQPLTITALIWLGLLGSCLALLLWFSLLNSVGPTKTSMVSYIFPLMGVILGMVFLHESPDWRVLVGGVLVVLAVVIVNSRGKKDNEEQKIVSLEKTESLDG
jgi:drug/metabolite transporter (DMT)-like permease